MPNEIVFGVLHSCNTVRVQCSVSIGGYSSTCMSHYLLTKRVLCAVTWLRDGRGKGFAFLQNVQAG